MRAIIGNKRIRPVIGVQQVAASSDKWWHHPEWLDVSNVADNEINLLVGDFGVAAVAFSVTVASSGTYYVDWGDGTQTSHSSATIAQHQYVVGSGKPCSLGYSTYKIRIWASNTITQFLVQAPTNYVPHSSNAVLPILEAYFGTTGLTSLSSAFYYVISLVALILPSSLPNCNSYNSILFWCSAIRYVSMPTTVYSGSIDTTYTFSNNYSLEFITLYNISLGAAVFYINPNVRYINLVNCTLQSNVSNLFYSTAKLKEITLPDGQNVTNASNMFCNSGIQQINNLENLGSRTVDVDFTSFSARATYGYPIPQIKIYNIYARISKIDIKGVNANNLNGAEVVRLYNAASSGFGGASPQIDVSYTKMSASALNDLFGDLPTMSGKTIKITGALGAASCNTSIATSKGWTVIN
jgi:hypothetical protein